MKKVNQIAISQFHQFKNSKAKSEYDDRACFDSLWDEIKNLEIILKFTCKR